MVGGLRWGLVVAVAVHVSGCPGPEVAPGVDAAGADVGGIDAASVLDAGPGDAGRCVVRDEDGDGADSITCGGGDCDDRDPDRAPRNTEICDPDDVDEDCNDATFGGLDADGDGVVSAVCCNRRSDGILRCGDDCDDLRRSVHPTASEVCDGFDNDCDDGIDETVTVPGFVDSDRDLHGDGSMPIEDCAGAPGFSPVGDDCDDADALSHAAQREICNGLDDDCDLAVDEGAGAVAWYPDADGDGFGDPDGSPAMSCGPIAGHRILATDCDDADPARSPGSSERCNGVDDDCDGRADFPVGPGDTEDDDLDGAPDTACTSGPEADCDDTDPTVHPDAPEIVDGRDNDCDGTTDGACETTSWWPDADGDGWGDGTAAPMRGCDPIPGRVTRDGDCADDDGDRSPAARDVCNGADDDCDLAVDEGAERLCAVPHALPVCAAGACGVGFCDRRYDDCSAAPGCETDISRSAANCGSCGVVCTAGPRSVASCADFECGLTCTPGFLDCDGVASTGCEIDAVVDPVNCATCGIICSDRPNASGVCVASACDVDCDAGYDDCDGALANGCETWIAGDRSNCAACGTACPIASDVCVRASCIAPPYPPPVPPTGAFAPTSDMVLPAGVYSFTTITIPVGVTIRTDGTGTLELRATGDVIVRGTIDLSGQPGGPGGSNRAGAGGATGHGMLVAPPGTCAAGGGGSGTAGGNAGGTSCGMGGRFGGGAGGNQAQAGGGGGGVAGGSGGSGMGQTTCVWPSGAGATASGAGVGGAPAMCGEGGRGGEAGMLGPALTMYEGGTQAGATSSIDFGRGGGGGSIGSLAAMDLAVADATFYPGSAGGGGGGCWGSATGGHGGGGAGGALRVSSLTSILIEGSVLANGAPGGAPGFFDQGGGGGSGSGGVVYLVAPAVRFTTTAIVSAVGGPAGAGGSMSVVQRGGAGGLGRVRVSTLPELCSLRGTIAPPPVSAADACAPTPGEGTPGRLYVGTYPN